MSKVWLGRRTLDFGHWTLDFGLWTLDKIMKEAVIVSAVRTAVGKAPKGTLRDTRPDDMGATAIKEAIARVPGLEASEVDDVIMGCAMPEAEQGMNVARAAAIRAGLPVETSAMTINRFCSSGLQTIAMASDRIRTNGANVIIAGGLESMSMIPMGGHIIRPNPYLVDHYPDFYLNMGLATENVARKFEVSREEQDEFAFRSHQRAAAALDADKFKDETVALQVVLEELDEKGKKQRREVADLPTRMTPRTHAHVERLLDASFLELQLAVHVLGLRLLVLDRAERRLEA